MASHKHQTILRGAAEELKRAGKIRTFDAVYRWVCPGCGGAQRTTRLADTVYALRNAYGWTIQTQVEPGNLAVYVLVGEGDMPGEGGSHPRQLVRDHAATWRCLTCNGTAVSIKGSPMLGGYISAPCTNCGVRATWKEVK